MSRDVDRIAQRQYKRLSRPLTAEVRKVAEDQAAKIEQAVNLFRRSPRSRACGARPRYKTASPVLVNPETWIADGEAYRGATELERHSLEITFNEAARRKRGASMIRANDPGRRFYLAQLGTAGRRWADPPLVFSKKG